MPALRELEAIGDHIAAENVTDAAETMVRIHQACQRLSTFPASGRPGRVAGTRELIVPGSPFIVAYTVRDGRALILAVLHGAREWPSTF